MHILITNDDGIDTPGLAALERAMRTIAEVRISVVAPAREHSMCGHRLTTHTPLPVVEKGQGRWAVEGTPADCVRIALFALRLQPDWVLSGVNAGGNLGQDIHVSGTCAAAREAAYHQLPAAAFSHYLIRGLAVDWQRTARWTRAVFDDLRQRPLADGEFWCVNFPHLPPAASELPAVRDCVPARSPLPVSFQPQPEGTYRYDARYADRGQDPGSDVAACFGGEVSVVRLKV